jgi:hypothetical protein
MLTLTGKLGNTPSCLGAVVLAYVPLVESPVPPQPTPSGGFLPTWRWRQIEKDKRKKEKLLEEERLRKLRERQEEEDIMVMIATILAD